MKRYILFACALLLAVAVIGCGSDTRYGIGNARDDEPGIAGYVVDRTDNRILVVSSEPLDFSGNGGDPEHYEAIWFSDVPEEIAIGEYVRVWYDIVMDSYPGQSSADRIEVVPSERPNGAALTQAEAINRALTSEQLDAQFFLVVRSLEYDEEAGEWNITLKDPMDDNRYDITIPD